VILEASHSFLILELPNLDILLIRIILAERNIKEYLQCSLDRFIASICSSPSWRYNKGGVIMRVDFLREKITR
jgi:hypothetical protein